MLLDKAEFPRDKVCAGWITPAVVAELNLNLADYATTRVLQPITGFRTSCLGGPELTTRFDGPVSYGIRRCEFDHYLLSRSDAELHLGEGLRTLEPSAEGWVVNGCWKTPLVVGAGGHFCPVARFAAGNAGVEDSAVLAQEIEFELTDAQREQCPVREDTPELFFCPDLKGYGWCFRKGPYLNVGLGRENERALSTCVAQFCEFLKSRGKLPAGTPEKFHGHAYRLYQYTPRTSRHATILLIGDAAGLAYSESGEGIRAAIESGIMAALAVLDAQATGKGNVQALLQARLAARFGPHPRFPLVRLIPAALKSRLAGQLLKSRWFTRHVLLNDWFLHRQQPPLSDAPTLSDEEVSAIGKRALA